ncbi:tripartite tricarboxylate transporter permease [Paracandidimonas soli]|uniref:Putative tricarboxylic transport membrane protein n=1 Tax=Paracandidimonas soli TaxID=1917182 RepID=A0A4V2VR88_9BURK|nr:tripartite tricarboxylate transporter permease [Paracandidimonas soli]TCU97289.1 putative tricarboxylic transport membrane protein [Paracandidimonas soli]
MESLSLLIGGIADALTVSVLVATLVGVLVGLLVGVLPGLGPAAGTAIMLPVAISFGGVEAIAGLGGIYYGAMFGGAVTSILLGIPGESASVMTVIDGHAMAKQGRAGEALGVSVFSSFIGGMLGLVFMSFLAVTIASVALKFGPTEMTAVMVFAFSLVSVLGGRNMIKGFVALFIGIWIGMIGMDPVGGPMRYTFGQVDLIDGVDFTIIAVGIFGLSEIFLSLSDKASSASSMMTYSFRQLLPRVGHMIRCKTAVAVGSVIGFVIGVLPGVGTTAATMLAYAVAKKIAPNAEEFGHGAMEGVAAPEASNNSAAYVSMVPMFTLGIPGSATTAIMLGGLLMIGLQPGPLLFQNHPDFVWTVFGSFWLGNVMLLVLTLLLIPFLASIVFVSTAILYPVIIGFILFGVFSIDYSMSDVLIALLAGVVGYVMLKLDYSPVPLVLGLVLGPLLENNIRRTMILSEGKLSVFFERPIALLFFVAAALVIVAPLFIRKLRKKDLAAT